jgi:tRNA nucleotidyltransferase/poly(A) polymerase
MNLLINMHGLKTFIGPAKVYVVGGYVRDHLLSISSQDRDLLVVGGTHELMVAHGFKQVGADFPVYLHPDTGDEYALARTERKVGPGYQGFITDSSATVTIEDDLARRDLTINSMAVDLETGELIDPYGGLSDLRHGILRHTSEAFKEDPVRILRSARFAARYGFFIHKTTRDFMLEMVRAGAMDELVPERVWAEMSRGLMEKNPSKMFQVLDDCDALRHMVAPWRGGKYASGLWTYDVYIADLNLAQRFALIGEDFQGDMYDVAKIPTDCARLSQLLNRWKNVIPQYQTLEPLQRLTLLTQVGIIGQNRNTDLWSQFLRIFLAWGYARFAQYIIPAIGMIEAHADKINQLSPPSDMSGKEIATWMMAQKKQIVEL